ncbi:cytochrome-c peroxidase [Oceanospirillum sediminis]|uniref:Methylamine utilization protein MauG n=1 Tax=Oceanospirillum sediminis TaxID=2760088 RepID=A0A839IWF5_9GAMM|nr:cytochrome c peroxidase [Oceanospirillum sediminis]MBB1488707.1 c-type cytochrome [Oceanospirillum sediminis]
MRFDLFKAALVCAALLNPEASFATDDTDSLKQLYQRPTSIPFPSDNPYSAEKAQLGKMLFFDQRLSRNFNMNCATCHNPSLGWEDGVQGAFGSQGVTLSRHSPTVLNMAWGKEFFWDGRATTLEEQIRGPVESPNEMNVSLDTVVERLSKVPGYQTWFERVFPDKGIHVDGILKAIATYERTIVSGTAPFDRWVSGDEKAISDSAIRGFKLFNGEAGCSSCHTGWNFTDNKYHDIGIFTPDEGRKAISQNVSDLHAFKTPGLRNIRQRAPYMHNGSMESLEQVMLHYMSGGIPRESRSELMKPVPLNQQEIRDLIAFMESLTGDDQPVSLPVLPY